MREGLAQLNQHISPHQHSRTKRIVFGIKVVQDIHHMKTVGEAIEHLEAKWGESKFSSSNFVAYLQSIGAVEKKKSRGKFKVANQ